MNKLEVKKFGDTLFLMNNTDSYVVNHEIKEKSDLIIAYRLIDSTNYDMVLSNADYTLNLMQGSTEIRIVNNELLKTVHSFKFIMGLEPVDFSTGSISERLQFLEDKLEDYALFVDGVDEPTTLPPLKTGETWVRTTTGYGVENIIDWYPNKQEEFLELFDNKKNEFIALYDEKENSFLLMYNNSLVVYYNKKQEFLELFDNKKNELIALYNEKEKSFLLMYNNSLIAIENNVKYVELLTNQTKTYRDDAENFVNKLYDMFGKTFENQGWIFAGTDGDGLDSFIEGGVA